MTFTPICKRIVFYLLIVLFGIGCTPRVQDVETVSDNPGVNTIPFYPENTLSFDSKRALDLMKADEARKEADFQEKVKERLHVGEDTDGLLFDPWISPSPPTSLPLALERFPKDRYGWPDWAAAIAAGLIKPKGSLSGEAEEEPSFEGDILFIINDDLMANVIFPHKAHNEWLSCKVCHPGIFKPKRGANQFSMYDIWGGEFCGRCHGKVAFQPKGFYNCNRCHRSRKGVQQFQDVLR